MGAGTATAAGASASSSSGIRTAFGGTRVGVNGWFCMGVLGN